MGAILLFFAKALVALIALASTVVAASAQNETSTTVRDYMVASGGITYRVRVALISKLSPKPTVGVILIPGGGGKVNFSDAGVPIAYDENTAPYSLESNFLVRTRTLFAQQGLMTAVVDFF